MLHNHDSYLFIESFYNLYVCVYRTIVINIFAKLNILRLVPVQNVLSFVRERFLENMV